MWNVLYDKGDISNQWGEGRIFSMVMGQLVATWKKNQVCTFHPKPR